MKRFASHYLYIPSYGFLKQYVVEIEDNGQVTDFFPLQEEVESIIWTPGVIRLVPYETIRGKDNIEKEPEYHILQFDLKEIKEIFPFANEEIIASNWAAIRLYPFDFIQMTAAADTELQILDKQTF